MRGSRGSKRSEMPDRRARTIRDRARSTGCGSGASVRDRAGDPYGAAKRDLFARQAGRELAPQIFTHSIRRQPGRVGKQS